MKRIRALLTRLRGLRGPQPPAPPAPPAQGLQVGRALAPAWQAGHLMICSRCGDKLAHPALTMPPTPTAPNLPPEASPKGQQTASAAAELAAVQGSQSPAEGQLRPSEGQEGSHQLPLDRSATALQAWLKRELKASGHWGPLRVVTTSCLGLCPRGAMAVALVSGAGPVRASAIDPLADRAGLLAQLRALSTDVSA